MAVFIKEDSAKLLKKEVPLVPKLTNIMVKKANYYSEIAPTLKGVKRAKKIAKAAEKEKYNTKIDKFKPSGSAVTLNTKEIKRWANALKHLPKNSDAFDANGGEEGKELVDDLLKQIRRNNHAVPMVEPVEKLVKDTKVSDSKLKPTKLGNADVYVENAISKKIYIKEDKLPLLKEVYNQLTIPFDNKYHEVDGKNIPMKQDYEYFIDWLEEIGHYGKLQGTSNEKPSEIINNLLKNPKYYKNLKSYVFGDLEGNGCVDEIIINCYEKMRNYQKYYEINLFNKPLDEIENDIDYIAYDETISEYEELLTDEGKKFFSELLDNILYCNLKDYGFIYHIDDNFQNGLLYIERVIAIPSIQGYSNNFNEEDFFQHLNNSYDAVGECWTWKKNGGSAYNGSGDEITFKGWVKLEDIDWKETILLNCYHLNDEMEIRLGENAMVQIDEITTEDGKHLPLQNSIIVPAYTGSYWSSEDMDENKEPKNILKESEEENSPQNLLRVLLQIGRYGNLKPSKMTNEMIIQQINHEIEINPNLEEFKEHINDYGFIDSVTTQNGKLYIERAININSVYNLLSYDGLGTSWSWAKNGAKAYFGEGNIQLIFRGYINAERVDWEKTVFLNAYPLNMQKELRVEIGRSIELSGFFFNGKNYKLKKPILINSGLSDIGIM